MVFSPYPQPPNSKIAVLENLFISVENYSSAFVGSSFLYILLRICGTPCIVLEDPNKDLGRSPRDRPLAGTRKARPVILVELEALGRYHADNSWSPG